MNGIISLISDFSIHCVLEDGRVSLAHLMEFSHFVDLYVLEDDIYLDEDAIEVYLAAFNDDPDNPLKRLTSIEFPSLTWSIFEISDNTRAIYDAAPLNHTFSMGSYEYWTNLSQKEKQTVLSTDQLKGPMWHSREGLLACSKALHLYIENALEELGKTTLTIMPSSRNLLPFLEVFHQMDTPALTLYNAVSNIHRKSLEGVLALTRPRTVYLPPLLTILLSRCQKRSELPRRLIELRAEFTAFRRAVRDWFSQMDQAESLKDKILIREELDNTISNLLKHYENKRRGFYKQVAGAFISAVEDGDVKKMITKPAFAMIKEGVTSLLPEMISVRRFTGLIDLMDQALEVNNYSGLLSRVFGDTLNISQQEVTEAKRYKHYLQSKYNLALPLPI